MKTFTLLKRAVLSVMFSAIAVVGFGQLITVGNGSTVTGTGNSYTGDTPFGTWYMDDQTQMLYPASEVAAAGGVSGFMNDLRFNITQVGSPAMTDLTIKIGFTSSATIYNLQNTAGYTTVYTNSSYNTSLGWNIFDFSSPVFWNGTDNIIVDVCFNNSSYSLNSHMTADFFSGRVACYYTDNPNGSICGLYTGYSYSRRAQCAFTILPPYADDAGIVAILSPVLPTCDLDSIDVEVVVQNAGQDTLYDCDIKWQINNGTPTTYSYTGVVNPQGGTDTLTLSTYSFTNFDDLTVWTENPNGATDSLPGNDTTAMGVASGLSGTYGIPGDYATFQDAADDLMTFGVCGPVVMEAANGTYSEQVSLGNVLGTSDSNSVTFTSVSGNMADVTLEFASSSTANNYVVDVNDADYVSFTNMTIRNTGTSIYGRAVVVQNNAMNFTVDNCHVIANSYPYTGDYTTAIYANGNNHNLTITNNTIEKGGYGIRVYGGGNTNRVENVTIEDNHMEDAYYMANYLWYIDGLNFNNNTVTKDTSATYYFGYGVYCYYVDDFNVNNNYIGASEGASYGYAYSLYMNYCIGSNNPKSKVMNNCVTSGIPGQTAYGYYPMYMYGSGNVDIINNSFNRTGGYTGNYYACYISQGGGITLKNNNFANLNSGYALYVYGLWTLNESDHNNFYTNSGTLIYQGTTQYSSLEAYQIGTGYDMNSVSTDPAYVDTLKCITCNDTLDGGGVNVGNMYDIDSNNRSTTTPDIGAVEYINASNFTLGPDTNICGDEYVIEAGPAQSVTWSVNGSSTTGNSYTLQASGTTPELFNISVSMTTAFCGTGTDQTQVTLVPDASLDSNVHICADETATLEPGGGSTATYSWSTGESTSSIMVNEPGQISVIKSEEGCESVASSMVTQSTAVAILDIEDCEDNAPITLDATIPDGTNYAWSGGNSMTSAVNTFDQSGSYTITATDAFGCVSVDSFELAILGEPVAVINHIGSGGTAIQFYSNNSTGLGQSTTYNWTFVNGDTSSTANPIYVFPWNGPPTTYTISLEINNGCGVDVETMEVTVDPLGVQDIESGSFAIYPNPTSDILNIATNDVEAGSISIIDLSGRTVLETPLTAGSNNLTVNVSTLAAGSYIVKIADTVQPLIIE
jgi:hypothetical protein